MLGRKLTDVLVLQQIQSAKAVISCIKMLTSIEIITKSNVSKQNEKNRKIAWNTQSVTGIFREEDSWHKIATWPICFPEMKVFICILTKKIAVTTASNLLSQLFQEISVNDSWEQTIMSLLKMLKRGKYVIYCYVIVGTCTYT